MNTFTEKALQNSIGLADHFRIACYCAECGKFVGNLTPATWYFHHGELCENCRKIMKGEK